MLWARTSIRIDGCNELYRTAKGQKIGRPPTTRGSAPRSITRKMVRYTPPQEGRPGGHDEVRAWTSSIPRSSSLKPPAGSDDRGS